MREDSGHTLNRLPEFLTMDVEDEDPIEESSVADCDFSQIQIQGYVSRTRDDIQNTIE